MNNSYQEVFISYSFGEHKDLVLQLEKEIAGSVLLRECGIRAQQLGHGDAQLAPPLQNSIKQASDSDFMICLLGTSLGSIPPDGDGRTYLEYELDAALESSDCDLLVYTVGEAYQEGPLSGEISSEMQLLLESLTDRITIGNIPSSDLGFISRNITKQLEKIVLQSFGADSESADFENADDPAFVSGFNMGNEQRWPYDYKPALNVIFNRENPFSKELVISDAPVVKDCVAHKQWGLLNLKYDNAVEAISNFNAVISQFGSDLTANFWLSRLLSFYSDSKDKESLKKAIERSKVAARVINTSDLSEEYKFIEALAYTHAAKASGKMGNREEMTRYLSQAQETLPSLFDLHELKVRDALSVLDKKQDNQQFLKQAVNGLKDIFRVRIGHYIYLLDKLRKDHPDSIGPVIVRFEAEIYKTMKSISRNQNEIENWVEVKLNKKFKRPKMELPKEGSALWTYVNYARKTCLRHFQCLQLLRQAIEELAQKRKSEEIAFEEEQARHSLFLGNRDKFRKLKELFEERIKTKNRQRLAMILVGIFLAAFLTALNTKLDLSPQKNFLLYASLGAVGFLCVRAQWNKYKKSSLEIHSIYKTIKSSLNAQKNVATTVDNISFDALEDEIEKSIERQEEVVNIRLCNLHDMKEWLESCVIKFNKSVDTFEQFTVSAHNAQYTTLLRSRTGVTPTRLGKRKREDLDLALYPSTKGYEALHEENKDSGFALIYNNRRLSAYGIELDQNIFVDKTTSSFSSEQVPEVA